LDGTSIIREWVAQLDWAGAPPFGGVLDSLLREINQGKAEDLI
jgi:hypothetical protein